MNLAIVKFSAHSNIYNEMMEEAKFTEFFYLPEMKVALKVLHELPVHLEDSFRCLKRSVLSWLSSQHTVRCSHKSKDTRVAESGWHQP